MSDVSDRHDRRHACDLCGHAARGLPWRAQVGWRLLFELDLNGAVAGRGGWRTLCGACLERAVELVRDLPLPGGYRGWQLVVGQSERRCGRCARRFIGVAGAAARAGRYCSDRCFWAARNRSGRLAAKAARTRTCVVCAVPLAPERRADARYCSARCRQASKRRRRASEGRR